MRDGLNIFKRQLVEILGDAVVFVERARIDIESLRPRQQQFIFATLDRLRDAYHNARAIPLGPTLHPLPRLSSGLDAGGWTLSHGNTESDYDASQSEPASSSRDNTTTMEIDMIENDTAVAQGSDPLSTYAEERGARLTPVTEEGQSAASADPRESGETHQEPSLAPSQKRKRELGDRSNDVENSDSEMGEGGHGNEANVPVGKARRR